MRQLDWVEQAWPRHLKQAQTDPTNNLHTMMYPKVQKYKWHYFFRREIFVLQFLTETYGLSAPVEMLSPMASFPTVVKFFPFLAENRMDSTVIVHGFDGISLHAPNSPLEGATKLKFVPFRYP